MLMHIVDKQFRPLCNVLIGNDQIILGDQYDSYIDPPEVCNRCFFTHMDNKYKTPKGPISVPEAL